MEKPTRQWNQVVIGSFCRWGIPAQRGQSTGQVSGLDGYGLANHYRHMDTGNDAVENLNVCQDAEVGFIIKWPPAVSGGFLG